MGSDLYFLERDYDRRRETLFWKLLDLLEALPNVKVSDSRIQAAIQHIKDCQIT